MLAVHDPSVLQRLVFATGRSVQDAWWLDPCVRGELCTHMCGSGSGVAAVTIAVDCEAANASRSLQCSEKRRPTRVCRMSETRLRMLKSVL